MTDVLQGSVPVPASAGLHDPALNSTHPLVVELAAAFGDWVLEHLVHSASNIAKSSR